MDKSSLSKCLTLLNKTSVAELARGPHDTQLSISVTTRETRLQIVLYRSRLVVRFWLKHKGNLI